jgi:SSS family transporter
MNLSPATLVVLLAYLAGITAFGSYLGRKRSSVDDYFLAGRSVPWWAIAACVVATETSTLTFTSIPGFSYVGDWSFLQLALGYVLGRILVATILVPAYFRGEVFTSYELLQKRFGPSVRGVAAAVFLVYRTIADGIRLHAAALVIAIVAGVPEYICILVLALAMILYTEEGGVKATIWTDVIQMFVYLAGAGLVLVTVSRVLPEGVGGALATATAAGKLQVIDTSFDLSKTYTFWAGLIGGVFLTLATHGTDHYLVQRLLVARREKAARTGLIVSGFVVLGQFAFFLFIGSLLWSYYGGQSFARVDEVLPTFVATEFPAAWMGFILAAVAAAALSPSLNSLASTTLKDFYLPYVDPKAGESKQIRLGRVFTVFWGLAQVAVALVAQRASSALEAGLAALSYASGPTVGAFLLGVLTKKANTPGTLIGMFAGLVAPSLVKLAIPMAWTWDVAVGSTTTFVVGFLLSNLMRPSVLRGISPESQRRSRRM